MTAPREPLSFGSPVTGPIPAGPPRFPGTRIAGPGPARQQERLAPQFAALQAALEAGRVDVDGETTEADPELVVVFDLAAPVAEFARAAARVPVRGRGTRLVVQSLCGLGLMGRGPL
ncbi:hypothetical protein MHPYR_840002 [uncultured Mycobacterium sp.]|uniref:Uncharacterized protein n=1 Tax=uncultured Mycobacterium sp. TaxID=171292 RepID=A0A1Y5PUN1_9MYCO|nr:hypothetical protein MHPYR_840002 [uncultured Mycobacterium sp.]